MRISLRLSLIDQKNTRHKSFTALPRCRLNTGRVVISNRHGDTLAELAVGRGRLYGQIGTGEAVFLNG